MKTHINRVFSCLGHVALTRSRVLPALIAWLSLIPAGPLTAQTFTTLHNFGGSPNDGAYPGASLILSGNTLYGTAEIRGSSGVGTVFKVNTDGTGFTTLHSFTAVFPYSYPDGTNSDGANPIGGLVLSGNSLYGTAEFGGSSGHGTIFRLSTDGTGFTILHSFSGTPSIAVSSPFTNSDGGNTLYGTAGGGGSSGAGTVFAVNTDGKAFTTLHAFTALVGYPYNTNSDGVGPAGLALSGNSLYGTAVQGGAWNGGTVFAVNTDGTGFTILHHFAGSPSDGAIPYAYGGLILSGNTLYGTAAAGGSAGNGTVFEVNSDGTGFTNLHNFTATYLYPFYYYNPYADYYYYYYGYYDPYYVVYVNINPDGADPVAQLILSGNTLYGTTEVGGSSRAGTVFSLSFPPPVAQCKHVTVSADVSCMADASIDDGSFDPDGDTITLVQSPPGPYPLGDTSVTLTVTDIHGVSDSCVATVTVADTTPPKILNIVANPNVLWPANHRLIPVNLIVDAVDNCDPSAEVRIVNVSSNEPQNPLAPDWQITGAQSLDLRAERLGKGQGRIYTIVVQCKDASGNLTTASVDVSVQHN